MGIGEEGGKSMDKSSSGDERAPITSPLAYLAAHYTTSDDLALQKQLSEDLARFSSLPEDSADPEVRKRFRSFVNDPRGDERIVFVEERGQIRPARRARAPVAAEMTVWTQPENAS